MTSRWRLPYLQVGRRPQPAAPGPDGTWTTGVLGAFRDDPFAFLVDVACRYGPVVRLPAGPRLFPAVMHLVSGPEEIRHVLVGNRDNYPKSGTYVPVRDIAGDGLLTSDGDRWHTDRRLLQPLFTPRTVSAATPVFDDAAERIAARWRTAAHHGEVIDVAADMTDLTLDVIGRALLGVDITGHTATISDALTSLLRDTEERMTSLPGLVTLWARFLPTPANRQAQQSLRRLRAVAESLIDQHTTNPDRTAANVVSTLTKAAATGELSRDQLIDHVLTFVLAGHETTATTLTYTWQLLAHHPAQAATLRDELDTHHLRAGIDAGHQRRLPYTGAVTREVLRLYPAAWIIERDAIDDDHIGGYRIPARSIVLVSPYVTHRLPDLWNEPEAFRPDRFLTDTVPDFGYLPFGAGPRACIGEPFAQWEATALLARLAAEFELHPTTKLIPPETAITLRPNSAVLMQPRIRQPATQQADPR